MGDSYDRISRGFGRELGSTDFDELNRVELADVSRTERKATLGDC
jgi:hypothetical protein